MQSIKDHLDKRLAREAVANKTAEQAAQEYFDSLPTIVSGKLPVKAEAIYTKTPYQFFLKVKDLCPLGRENKEPLFFVTNEAAIGASADPVTVYFREPGELARGAFSWIAAAFMIPCPLGVIRAELLPDGKSRLTVSAHDESWPKLCKTWELLKEKIKDWLDAQPTPSAAPSGGQDKTKSTFSPEYRAKLRHDLATYFGREDLRNLCFDLGIPHENFPEPLDSMAREIIAHCERVDRISALVAKCKEWRPNMSWDDMPDAARKV